MSDRKCKSSFSRTKRFNTVGYAMLGSFLISTVIIASDSRLAAAPFGEPSRQQLQSAACCVVTAVDPREGLITARETTSGRLFQFNVQDKQLVAKLSPGQAVQADFQALWAMLPSSPNRYKIVNIIETGRQPAPRPPGAPSIGGVPTPPSKGVAPAPPSAGSPQTTPGTTSPCPTVTSAAFLRIDGVQGESLDPCHKGQIELTAFKTGGGQTIAISKRIDIASPRLFLNGVSGTHMKNAELTLYTTGSQPQRMIYTMTDLIVSSIAQNVGPGTREDVALTYAKLETRSSPAAVSIRPPTGEPPVEIFLRLDGIQGDAQNPAHRDEILARTLGNGVSVPSSGGMSTGAAQIQDFVIIKNVDKASPALMSAYQQGRHIKQGIITLARGGQDFYRYKIYDIIVSSISQTIQGENLGLRFGKIEIEYGAGAAPAGGAVPKVGWDIQQNKKM